MASAEENIHQDNNNTDRKSHDLPTGSEGSRATSPGPPASSSATTAAEDDRSGNCATPDAETKDEEVPTTQADSDPNIIGWDGPDDPENPTNFSARVKILNIGIISVLTFITPLASSMFAPGVPELMAEFRSSNELLADFVVSVYVLGFAVGPLVLAPASELYGRAVIYHVCNVGFIVLSVACALSTNLGMLIAFRFFQGCFGVAPVTNGGGTIADLVIQEKRGGVIAIFALGPVLGPVIGPVAGGYLVSGHGWRWVFWVLAIIGGFFTVMSLLFLRETYPTILLKRKTARLVKETGNTDLRSRDDAGESVQQLFVRSIVRPTKILIYSPIALVTSLYIGLVYGYQYLMFSTFTFVFEEQYGFPTQSAGLSFLGMGIGSLLGLFVIGIASDRIVKAKSQPSPGAPSGTMQPEYRLPPLIVGAFLIPAGLFMYGWSAQYGTHWIVPIVGTGFVGAGNVSVFMSIISYTVDAFNIYAASALAANTVVRSIAGALLPLAGQSMYAALGLGWGNSLLGFIAIACIPVPVVMLKYGERMRKSFDVSRL